MAIVGISGSPFPDGNTDRLVQSILEQSGQERVFVNLSTLEFVSCRGCAHLCAKTNLCPLEDGLRPYESSEGPALKHFEESVRGWGHRMRHLGALYHATRIPPCYKCGVAKACRIGGLWSMLEKDEARLQEFEITPDKFTRWEDCARTVAEVERHSRSLRDAIAA